MFGFGKKIKEPFLSLQGNVDFKVFIDLIIAIRIDLLEDLAREKEEKNVRYLQGQVDALHAFLINLVPSEILKARMLEIMKAKEEMAKEEAEKQLRDTSL